MITALSLSLLANVALMAFIVARWPRTRRVVLAARRMAHNARRRPRALAPDESMPDYEDHDAWASAHHLSPPSIDLRTPPPAAFVLPATLEQAASMVGVPIPTTTSQEQ